MHYPFLNNSLTDSGCVREELLAQLPAAETLMVLQLSETHMELKVKLEDRNQIWGQKIKGPLYLSGRRER